MKTIGEIKTEFNGAEEAQWQSLCQEYSQDQRAGERVPVGTQKLADRVVSLRREDGRQVHRHVEQQKQHEEKTRDTHNQFPPDGRC